MNEPAKKIKNRFAIIGTCMVAQAGAARVRQLVLANRLDDARKSLEQLRQDVRILEDQLDAACYYDEVES